LWRGTSEVFRWAEVAVAAAAGTGAPRLAEALLSASTGAWQRGDLDAATAAAHMINDATTPLDPAATRASLEARADVALLIGDLEVATTLFTEAHTLACDAGDRLQAVWDLGSASLAIAYRGDTQRAYDLSAEVSAVAERCDSPSARAFAHFVIGEILATADPETAEPQLLEAIQLAETADSRFVVGLAEVALAAVKIRQQDVATALAYCEEAINEWHRAGAWTPLWVTLRTVLDLLTRVEAYREASVLYGAIGATRAGAPPFGADATRLRDARERLRAELGDEAFERHAQQGSTMTEDDVVALALDALNRMASRYISR
jgi:ATP/maltotriose-dependent transcriptional regulator MalT